MNEKGMIPGSKGLTFAGVGTAIGTALATIAGTTLAAPAVIGLGTGLLIWGIKEMVTSKKD